MKRAESKGGEEYRKESIGPGLSNTLVVDQQYYKNAEHDATIGENWENLVQEFFQQADGIGWPSYK